MNKEEEDKIWNDEVKPKGNRPPFKFDKELNDSMDKVKKIIEEEEEEDK